MAETTLQIYDPQDAAAAVPETAGALNAGSMQQGITITQRAPLLKRIVWWLSLAVMLPVGLGVLQMLALLVQAERVRGALERGAATAQLPKATSLSLLVRTSQALSEITFLDFSLHGYCDVNGSLARRESLGTIYHSGGDRRRYLGDDYLFAPGDVVGVDARVPSAKLLPRWLGPRLPWVDIDEVHVHWQVTVGQEQ